MFVFESFGRLFVGYLRFLVSTMETIEAANSLAGAILFGAPFTQPSSMGKSIRMNEITRDRDFAVDLGFGSVTFCRDERGPYAHVVADLNMLLGPEEPRENSIEVDMRFECHPERESVVQVVERSRRHLMGLLRAALDRIEAETSDSLLFGEQSPSTSSRP